MRAPLSRRALGELLLVVALAVAASAISVANLFVQDDGAIIQRDAGIHGFSLSRIFLEPYWPAPFFRDLYRPLSSSFFAAEWWLGGGSPATYRCLSIALYAACALACYALARHLFSPRIAWWVAAIFAVHPVHVEAVAVGVNQSELLVGLMLVLTTTWYIERRREGPPGWREAVAVAGVTLLAGFTKEHGIVLPAIIAATEVLLFSDPPRVIDRLLGLRRLFLTSTLAVILVAWPRFYLFKEAKGSFTAEGLLGLNLLERTFTMLKVVPRWIYLIIWPYHLQADYSPQVITGEHTFVLESGLGLALLLLVAWIGVRTLKASPTLAFGLAFAAIAVLPVSNILVPTGIVLAERTLLIPSFGAMIALGGLATIIADRWAWERFQGAIRLALELVLVLGLIRSAMRFRVWHDPLTLSTQTVQDAPLSYRAWYGLGAVLIDGGMIEDGQKYLQNAIRLSPNSSPLYFTLADSYRREGHCEEAIEYYMRGLNIVGSSTPRAGLIACRVWLGKYAEARGEAMIGIQGGTDLKLFHHWLRIIDSAIAVKAPPRTVRFPTDTLPSVQVRP